MLTISSSFTLKINRIYIIILNLFYQEHNIRQCTYMDWAPSAWMLAIKRVEATILEGYIPWHTYWAHTIVNIIMNIGLTRIKEVCERPTSYQAYYFSFNMHKHINTLYVLLPLFVLNLIWIYFGIKRSTVIETLIAQYVQILK